MATPYSFTQPIRYYKANDPYYYEVDNIPIRQLEENILFIKDKVEGLGGKTGGVGASLGLGGGGGQKGSSRISSEGYLTPNSEISITNIKQLKPKCSGNDRLVTVNAGTFTARINDAYSIDRPLAELFYSAGAPNGLNLVPSLQQFWTTAERDAVWDAFTKSSGSGGCPYNINGLAYTFTFHSSPGGLGGNWGVTSTPPVSTGEGSENYPHYTGVGATASANLRWPGVSLGPLSPSQLGQIIGNTYTFSLLPTVHLAFVQMWRGVFRTAVVDFPDSSLDIPQWSDDDFYYYDDDGNVVQISDATQRIDLLVAYSLPIDSVSGAIQDYEEEFCTGTTPKPKILTQPQLGLIRGAGVGIRKNNLSVPPSIGTTEGCEEADPGSAGSKRILANLNDTDSTANIGVSAINGSVIHGSFPSPDDLLNMAPLLALNVASDDFQLIGQTALPIAYIVVKESSTLISPEDIIDIRPFLRTTEFTYNERAGVAAANPPLSLANPAVGLFQLQTVVNELNTQVAAAGAPGGEPDSGKALYTDYVMGGIAYGVEGTLLTMNEQAGEPEDPWGGITRGETNYVDPGGQGTFSFAPFTSSKYFLETATDEERQAFLQYVYTDRQSHLKRWISDPNAAYSYNTGTYLGLPPTGSGGRNIPLYPEWDMPIDNANYQVVMGQVASVGGNVPSPKPTWWMWFEAMNEDRPLSYVPGGVGSGWPSTTSSYLSKLYGFGFGDLAQSGKTGEGEISVVTKALEITFPSWVNDYDVLVEYVNCGPVTSTTVAQGSQWQIMNGFGSGLYINKGPVVSASGKKKAVFRINSSTQARPMASNGMVAGPGRITDEKGGAQSSFTGPGSKGRVGAITNNYTYQWLSYTVCLPQFINPNYGMAEQNLAQAPTTRNAPKFGASYYPTVKFTVIGYKDRPSDINTSYNSSNNWTLLQNTTVGSTAELINQTKAPLQVNTGGYTAVSKIDIEDA